ncbi:hypothetical protein BGZ70_003357 [Mortierella alpina]|uniref:Uncharacterized protein n=1 Tax=Mortierella alpina TaxID=64518 RepID=A0A9P6M567_MORAP|nr:hypothetical protein BGZ70_003357 [Mortierella alpina]
MACVAPLPMDIPTSVVPDQDTLKSMTNAPTSPDHSPPNDDSSYSLTRNGSATSTLPMMTPIPYKNENLLPLPLADPISFTGKDDEKTKLRQFEFPVALPNSDIKVDPLSYQSYLNHPFTQHRQQKFQEQQTHQQKPHQTYASKYTSYTNSSQTRVRVSSNAYHKPSTTSALSLIEKEKMTFQYQSHRDSMVSPPPPPYLHSDRGPNTPFSAMSNKRKSLPASASASSPTVAAARTARELKRHSLPVTPSPALGVQWPSAMTMTVAAVTRPKLARTLPPQAIPLFYPSGGELRSPSPLSAVTPTAVFTPRSASRLQDRSETETLYSIRSNVALPSASTHRLRGLHLAGMQHPLTAAGTSRSTREHFPTFWQDAKEHRMHWAFYSFGVMAIGSLVWVAMMPALFALAAVLPVVVALVLGAQYGGYRWRRRKYTKQQLKDRQLSATAISSMRAASAALSHSRSSSMLPHAPTVTVPVHTSHAHRGSQSSMHTSVGSINSDSFLEPHHPSPPPNLKSQFQHQYYRSSASMSHPLSPPRRFAEGYCPHAESRSQSPSPEYRQSWQTQQSQKTLGGSSNRQSQAMQRQNSASSVASSETVSSSSTASEAQCDPPKVAPLPPVVKSLVVEPVSEPANQATPSPESPTLESAMMPPPPAYVSRKCEETLMMAESDANGDAEASAGETLSEKARLSVALPEIASMGDLSSEFSIDFGSFQY